MAAQLVRGGVRLVVLPQHSACIELLGQACSTQRLGGHAPAPHLYTAAHLPAPLPQIAALPNLLELQIDQAQYSSGSIAAISRLTALTSLTLNSCSSLPLGITGLTALAHLQLDWVPCVEAEPAALLDAALSQPQTRLTALIIAGENSRWLPASLSRLTGLQCLLWQHPAPDAGEEAAARPLPLLPTLRWLKADWELLVISRAALAAAQRLEHVCIADMPWFDDTANWWAFWRWASEHPPLCSLALDAWNDESYDPRDDTPFTSDLFDALMALRTVRPGLRVFRYGSEGNPPSFLSEARRQAP